jgi:hypothetical protein
VSWNAAGRPHPQGPHPAALLLLLLPNHLWVVLLASPPALVRRCWCLP